MTLKSIFFWDMTPCSALSGTRRHIPEEDTLQNHRCENLKSYKGWLYLYEIAKAADLHSDSSQNLLKSYITLTEYLQFHEGLYEINLIQAYLTFSTKIVKSRALSWYINFTGLRETICDIILIYYTIKFRF
jgi:hypothetical protein